MPRDFFAAPAWSPVVPGYADVMVTSTTTHRQSPAHDHDQATGPAPESRRRGGLGTVLRDFPWIHLGIGLTGNALFVIGSVMFFWPAVKTAAIWVFVVASLGMLVGSVGELLVRIEKKRTGSD